MHYRAWQQHAGLMPKHLPGSPHRLAEHRRSHALTLLQTPGKILYDIEEGNTTESEQQNSASLQPNQVLISTKFKAYAMQRTIL